MTLHHIVGIVALIEGNSHEKLFSFVSAIFQKAISLSRLRSSSRKLISTIFKVEFLIPSKFLNRKFGFEKIDLEVTVTMKRGRSVEERIAIKKGLFEFCFEFIDF